MPEEWYKIEGPKLGPPVLIGLHMMGGSNGRDMIGREEDVL